jgi:hypothetical protein
MPCGICLAAMDITWKGVQLMSRQLLMCGLLAAAILTFTGCIGTSDTNTQQVRAGLQPNSTRPLTEPKASAASGANPPLCAPPAIATGDLFASAKGPAPCSDPPNQTQEVVEQPADINRSF